MKQTIKFVGSFVCILTLLMCTTLGAAPKVYKSSFERPPAQVVKSLKATVGKPFSAGYVFVDGKYLPPPYKVERYGNVIRINGTQVTGPVIPWEEFIKTQEGVSVSKSETPPEAEPEDEPEEEEEEESEDEFDFDFGDDSSLDDLFSDEPSEPKKKEQPKKKKVAKPKKPKVVVTYTFDGEFQPNDKTKALVAKINAERTKIDKALRKGGYMCFGAGYGAEVSGSAAIAERVIPKLPNIMKNNTSREAFGQALRQAGIAFFPSRLVDDLFRNRIDYIHLSNRLATEEEEKKWNSLL